MRAQFFIATLALGLVLLAAPLLAWGASLRTVAIDAALGLVPAYGFLRLVLRTKT